MTTKLFDLLFQNRALFQEVVPKNFFKKPHAELNLSAELINFLRKNPKLKLSAKDAINPYKCTQLVKKIHKEKGLVWSYGGYLENRSIALQNSYLKKTKCWLHLGIDINLPIGTPVQAAFNGIVYAADSDYPEEGGWGNYIILEHKIAGVKFYSIYGHLSKNCLADRDQTISSGEIIGLVGNQEENGFWFPHTHFQFISETEIKRAGNPFTLDGYGSEKDLPYLKENYPDPLVALPMGHKK